MLERRYEALSLFGAHGARKYVNAAERWRFLESARALPAEPRLFCLTLAFSGARISEALALTPTAIDIEGGAVNLATLKRRRPGVVRQVPLPPSLLDELDRSFNLRKAQLDPDSAHRRLWRFSRATAYRYVKAVMVSARIIGLPAMPKGLRHGFCVNAIQSRVPLHLVQRWLGHASLRTTGIYAELAGPEERAFAKRMWRMAGPIWSNAPFRRFARNIARVLRRYRSLGAVLRFADRIVGRSPL